MPWNNTEAERRREPIVVLRAMMTLKAAIPGKCLENVQVLTIITGVRSVVFFCFDTVSAALLHEYY